MKKQTNSLLDDQNFSKPKSNRLSILICVLFVVLIVLSSVNITTDWYTEVKMLMLGTGGLSGYLFAKSFFFIKRWHNLLVAAIASVISILILIRYQNFIFAYSIFLVVFVVFFLFYLVKAMRIKKYNQQFKS